MNKQLPLPFSHASSMGEDDFLVTSSNREAATWIEKWPDWPAHGLIITGHSSSGKTHLLTLWQIKSGGQIMTTAEILQMSPSSIASISQSVAIDDVDVLAGNVRGEENLFHLYNHLKSHKLSLFLTMKRGAGQAGFTLPDLHSRLLTLPCASIGAPDDPLLEGLIVKQFRDRQLDLDAGVIAYLSCHMARDAASIAELVEKLDQASLAEGRKITIALARRIMEEEND